VLVLTFENIEYLLVNRNLKNVRVKMYSWMTFNREMIFFSTRKICQHFNPTCKVRKPLVRQLILTGGC